MENVLGQFSMTDVGVAAAGLLLVLFGRKLFWLVLAGLGFLLGLVIFDRFFQGQNELLRLALALVCGVIGGFLAVFVQKVAIRIAGLIGGGFAGYWLISSWAASQSDPRIIVAVAVIVGAIVGLLLAGLLFETALIIVSSLAGASLFLQGSHLPERFVPWVYLVLLVVGVVVQTGIARSRRTAQPARNPPPEKKKR